MKEKRLRDKTWDDYGISKYRYRELKNFCLQYDEKKEKIQYGISAIPVEGSTGSSGTGDPTSKKAISHVGYIEDIQMIESCAMGTDMMLYPYILKSVTRDLAYEDIEYDNELGRIPCGKTDFYAYRKKFYSLLDERKDRKKYA